MENLNNTAEDIQAQNNNVPTFAHPGMPLPQRTPSDGPPEQKSTDNVVTNHNRVKQRPDVSHLKWLRPSSRSRVADEATAVTRLAAGQGKAGTKETVLCSCSSTSCRQNNPLGLLYHGIRTLWNTTPWAERAAGMELFFSMLAEVYPSVPKYNCVIAPTAMLLLGDSPLLKKNTSQIFYWLFSAMVALSFVIDFAWMASPYQTMASGLQLAGTGYNGYLNTVPSSVWGGYQFAATMLGFKYPLRFFYWHCLMTRSPFGKKVLRILNRRVLLFVPLCRESSNPLKEVENRLIAMMWMQLVLGVLMLGLGVVTTISLTWSQQFTDNNVGIPLVGLMIIKGCTAMFVGWVLLRKMDLSAVLALFGCLNMLSSAPWVVEKIKNIRNNPQLPQPRRVQLTDRYLQSATAVKLVDWFVGLWVWIAMGAVSSNAFSNFQVSVAGVLAGVVFLLVMLDIWLIFLAYSVFTIIREQLLAKKKTEGPEDEENKSENSSEEHSSSEDESDESSSSENSFSESDASQSSEENHPLTPSNKTLSQKKEHHAGQGLEFAPNQKDMHPESPGYPFDFEIAFDKNYNQQARRPSTFQLNEEFVSTPEQFNAFWQSSLYRQARCICRIQHIPTIEIISNHLISQFFFVVASGKVEVYSKIYACAKSKTNHQEDNTFLMEMVFDRENKTLSLTFKSKKPELTAFFVQALNLKAIVGTHTFL